jgi:two-component system sensor histidine kinase KdpD
VSELIRRVVRRLEPYAGDHPIRYNIPENLPAVKLDAIQIEQVLTNLIENAIKYSPQGAPVTVTAWVDSVPADGRELRIAVSDRGAGIAPNEQEKIFDKFYRIAGSARQARGTGMGLAIVKGLVEAHGGRVLVESVPGQGSTFTVALPIEEAEAPRKAALPVRQATRPAS